MRQYCFVAAAVAVVSHVRRIIVCTDRLEAQQLRVLRCTAYRERDMEAGISSNYSDIFIQTVLLI